MAKVKITEISNTALQAANIRPVTAAFLQQALKIEGDKDKTAAARKNKDFKKYHDEYSALRASLKVAGEVSEPITITDLTVDEQKSDKTTATYGVISGHTRLAIAQALGWEEIDAVVIPNLDRDKVAELAVQANVSGTSMTEGEKAEQVHALLSRKQLGKDGNPKTYSKDTKTAKKGQAKTWTNGQVAAALGMSEANVRRLAKVYNGGGKKTTPKAQAPKLDVTKYATTDGKVITIDDATDNAINGISDALDAYEEDSKIENALAIFDMAGELTEAMTAIRATLQSIDSVKMAIRERTAAALKAARETTKTADKAPTKKNALAAKLKAIAAEKEAKEK